jgi:hypothetical protein
MTEDPVKLYVVVMAVLLVVLGFVAWKSYGDAQAYADAMARAPGEAQRLRDFASEVNQLCDQLKNSKIGIGELELVESAGKRHGLVTSNLKKEEGRAPGSGRGRELKLIYRFGTGSSSAPATRAQIAAFCKQVEDDSQGILKTAEIELGRAKGSGIPNPGEQDIVTNEKYTGMVVFMKRFIESQE